MIDAKAMAEAMDYIIEHVTKAYGMAFRGTVDDPEAEMMTVATELGNVIGAAMVIKFQCEQAGKPTMRGER